MTFISRTLGLAGAMLVLAGCNATNELANRLADAGVGETAESLAMQCGIDVNCGDGLAQGNASVSGVASVDAFFGSVLSFQTKADHVSADIEASLSTTRADFGIDAAADLQAELSARIQQNVEGAVSMRTEPARCAVDAQAALEAQARCDTSIDPAKVSMLCDGSCDVQTNTQVDCGTDAQLNCTFNPPTGSCEGTCTGTCDAQLSAAAKCEGVCRGSCSGACSAYADSGGTECAGACDGTCQGSCQVEMMTAASCSGKCSGECTVSAPSSVCMSAIRAHCDASASGMVACRGRCEGRVVPPKAKAECEATARAQTKLEVECTPPRTVLDYRLKTVTDTEGQARFVSAMENLRVRLPGLLARLEQASSVSAAGVGLTSDAKDAVKGGIQAAAKAVSKGDLRTVFGLTCAAREVEHVADTIKDSSDRLTKSVHDCTGVRAALGAP
jgi:hypothetical protein